MAQLLSHPIFISSKFKNKIVLRDQTLSIQKLVLQKKSMQEEEEGEEMLFNWKMRGNNVNAMCQKEFSQQQHRLGFMHLNPCKTDFKAL